MSPLHGFGKIHKQFVISYDRQDGCLKLFLATPGLRLSSARAVSDLLESARERV